MFSTRSFVCVSISMGLTDTLFVTTEPAPHNGVVTQHHAGQNGGIHTDPAVFAKHDVFAG